MSGITVEVVYAHSDRQELKKLQLPAESRVRDALAASGLLEQFPEINARSGNVGIFGRIASLNAPLRHGDRVEIYRPLISDPKETRRRRAARQKND